jgi:hypothetical protein
MLGASNPDTKLIGEILICLVRMARGPRALVAIRIDREVAKTRSGTVPNLKSNSAGNSKTSRLFTPV